MFSQYTNHIYFLLLYILYNQLICKHPLPFLKPRCSTPIYSLVRFPITLHLSLSTFTPLYQHISFSLSLFLPCTVQRNTINVQGPPPLPPFLPPSCTPSTIFPAISAVFTEITEKCSRAEGESGKIFACTLNGKAVLLGRSGQHLVNLDGGNRI